MFVLTDSLIKNCLSEKKNILLRENLGFYLQVYPSGKKAFFFEYKEGRKKHRLSLGEYPYLSLKEARNLRDKCIGILMLGQILTEEELFDDKDYINPLKKEEYLKQIDFWRTVKDSKENISFFENKLKNISELETILNSGKDVLTFKSFARKNHS
jgi:hypothetical protein